MVEICQGNMQMQSSQLNAICKGDYKIKEVFLRRIDDLKGYASTLFEGVCIRHYITIAMS